MALGTVTESESDLDLRADRPWVCVVWDDPVNLMSYVTQVFMVLFGYSSRRKSSNWNAEHQELP